MEETDIKIYKIKILNKIEIIQKEIINKTKEIEKLIKELELLENG